MGMINNRQCKFSMLIAANGGVLGLIPRTGSKRATCLREGSFANSELSLRVSNSKKSEEIAWSKYWTLPVFSMDDDGIYRNQAYQKKPFDGTDHDAKHLAFYGW